MATEDVDIVAVGSASRETVVIVHEGARGRRGLQGDQGDQGPAGESVRPVEPWSPGNTYAPRDMVSAEGSAGPGVVAYFTQREGTATEPSTIPPAQEPIRWLESGVTDLRAVTASIWPVPQSAHGFSLVGTPIAFDRMSGRWIPAGNRIGDPRAIAVVRSVEDANNFWAQSNGELPNVDPALIQPDGATWIPGRTYYVAAAAGRITLTAPSDDPGAVVHPILVAVGGGQGNTSDCVVLSWAPVETAPTARRIAPRKRFYFLTSGSTTSISGADKYGRTLSVQVSEDTQVYSAGLNLRQTVQGQAAQQFNIAPDGLTINFTPAIADGIELEVETIGSDPNLLVQPNTAWKLDDISSQFDGSTLTFVLTIDGGTEFRAANAENININIDGVPQEPGRDYTVTLTSAPRTQINFTEAPEAGARFWGVAGLPYGATP